MERKKILVCGAGGFIGFHLSSKLQRMGHFVVGVDLKYPEFSEHDCDEFVIMDLTDFKNTQSLMNKFNFDEVYQLAADMGGAGYINSGCNDAEVVWNSMTINLNVLKLSTMTGVKKIFFSSSACVYPEHKQLGTTPEELREDTVYPAFPDTEYGWEKLFSERLYKTFSKQLGIEVRIGRFHNIFGNHGTWDGGREKAPAAMCRKVAQYNLGLINKIDIWGDGEQTRSFLYIEEAIEGIILLMDSDYSEPLNIGSDILISINDLVKMIMKFDEKHLILIDHIDGPQGVRGRNSNNEKIEEVLNWKPTLKLEYGIEKTYKWIKAQIINKELRNGI